jgi:hypothetical protein
MTGVVDFSRLQGRVALPIIMLVNDILKQEYYRIKMTYTSTKNTGRKLSHFPNEALMLPLLNMVNN